MEFRHLKTFRTVATLCSFYKAAELLHYAQSTVSEQIKALESDLNVKLFIRSGKSITLTEAGERLLKYAQKVLNIEDEIRSEISTLNECQGTLSIRIPQTVSIYYLPPIVKAFHTQYPKVRCHFINCTYFSLQQEFQSGITDLAFLMTNDDFMPPDLEVEILSRIPLAMVTYPANPLLEKGTIDIQDLQNQTLLLSKIDCSYRRMLERSLIENKIKPKVILDFSSLESIKYCLIQGMGITFISEIAVTEELSNGILSRLQWTGEKPDVNLLMIWRKDKWISPALKAFIEMVRSHWSEG